MVWKPPFPTPSPAFASLAALSRAQLRAEFQSNPLGTVTVLCDEMAFDDWKYPLSYSSNYERRKLAIQAKECLEAIGPEALPSLLRAFEVEASKPGAQLLMGTLVALRRVPFAPTSSTARSIIKELFLQPKRELLRGLLCYLRSTNSRDGAVLLLEENIRFHSAQENQARGYLPHDYHRDLCRALTQCSHYCVEELVEQLEHKVSLGDYNDCLYGDLCSALGRAGDPRAIPFLRRWETRDSCFARSIPRVLRFIKSKEAEEYLIELSLHPDDWVRVSACVAMGITKNPIFYCTLRDRLSDTSAGVKAVAETALARWGVDPTNPTALP